MAIGASKHYNSFKIIGNNIRVMRKKLHLSQEQVAFKLNSARNYIGCIERAEKMPSLDFLFNIAEVLECRVVDLLANI